MSEKAVADFVGRSVVDPSGDASDRPREARVVMSRRRLVVATDDRLTVPLSDVHRVAVGQVPPHLREVFDDSVTIAFETDHRRRTVVVEGETDTIARFVNVLFTCLLNGSVVELRPVVNQDGRMTDSEPERATTSVHPGRIDFSVESDVESIRTAQVVDVQRRVETETERPVLVVTQATSVGVVASSISFESRRIANLLDGCLRREYARRQREVADVDLTEPELRTLVAVYTVGEDVDLQELLDRPDSAGSDVDDSQGTVRVRGDGTGSTVDDGDDLDVAEVIVSLLEKGLLETDGGDLRPTVRGHVVVHGRYRDAFG